MKAKLTTFIVLLFLFLFFPTLLFSQEFKWETKLDFFFDNTEFAESKLTRDQTMAGVRLSQEIGWKFDEKNYIMGGVDALKSLGGEDFINNFNILAYYQLKDENTLLKVGAFHRGDLLDDYSTLFFQDSVAFYKPTMEGIYFQKGDNGQFVKLWLDWTGLQSVETRESFFLGASAYKEFGKYLFADLQSYMFHYATTRPKQLDMSVADNLLGQLSLGVKYSNKRGLDKLKISAGVLAGYERDRRLPDDYKTPLGLVVRGDVEYKAFGMENLLYLGQKRMNYYEDFGNQMYWGTPFLRAGNYYQNKLYWNFLDNPNVKGQLAAKTHVAEGNVYFEQMLTLSAKINNFTPKTPKRQESIWEWFFPKEEERRGRSFEL